MNYRFTGFFIFGLLIMALAGCGKEESSAAASASPLNLNYSGTYSLDGLNCNGVNVLISGATETYVLNHETKKGTATYADDNCTATVNFDINETANGIQFVNRQVSCSNPGCSVDVDLVYTGIVQTENATCPEDFANTAIPDTYVPTTTDLTLSSLYNGISCTQSFGRQ